jgi:hypothetical protein
VRAAPNLNKEGASRLGTLTLDGESQFFLAWLLYYLKVYCCALLGLASVGCGCGPFSSPVSVYP